LAKNSVTNFMDSPYKTLRNKCDRKTNN